MPSWPIHIALASKLKIKYNLTDDFIIGNVIPDATNGFIIKNISNTIYHSKTHFNFQGPSRPPKNDVQKFLEVYNDKINNPIIFGSLIHLITDNYFNEYTYRNHIESIDGRKFALLNDGSKIQTSKPWKLKQEDFGVFGNYLIVNTKLGIEVSSTNLTNDLKKDLIYQLTESDIKLIIDKINSFITRDVSTSYNLKIFTLDELEKLFDDCYKYLDSIVEDIDNKKILVKRKD